MKSMNCRRPGIILCFLIFLIGSCRGGPGALKFDNGSSFSGAASARNETRDKIDTGRTFQVFFSLREKEDCIKISVNALSADEAAPRIFFTVDKEVDVSRFGGSGRSVFFAELARNYDFSWNAEKDLVVCSSDADPIKKLSGDIYRIRFTAFRDQDFNYDINIMAGNKIIIEENYPENK